MRLVVNLSPKEESTLRLVVNLLPKEERALCAEV